MPHAFVTSTKCVFAWRFQRTMYSSLGRKIKFILYWVDKFEQVWNFVNCVVDANWNYVRQGNRFHVKSRILSPYSNRFYLKKGLRMRNFTWNRFPIKNLLMIPCLHPSWKAHTWIEICASLNHRKKTKVDGSRLIPRKHTETLVLLSVR